MSVLVFDVHLEQAHGSGVATKQDLKEMELKITDTTSELIRWIVGAGFLQTALITALLLKVSSGL